MKRKITAMAKIDRNIIGITLALVVVCALLAGRYFYSLSGVNNPNHTVTPTSTPTPFPTPITKEEPLDIGPHKIVFQRNNTLWTFDLTNKMEKNLNIGIKEGNGDTFIQSPDLRYVVYRGRDKFLYILNVETGEREKIIDWHDAPNHWETDAVPYVWSPHRHELIFRLQSIEGCVDCSEEFYKGKIVNPDVQFGMYLFNVEANKLTYLSELEWTYPRMYHWSPNPVKIYTIDEKAENPKIHLYNIETNSVQEIPFNSFSKNFIQESFSSTDWWVAYYDIHWGEGKSRLVVRNLLTGEERTPYNGDEFANYFPRWSRDGRYVWLSDQITNKTMKYDLLSDAYYVESDDVTYMRQWIKDEYGVAIKFERYIPKEANPQLDGIFLINTIDGSVIRRFEGATPSDTY